MPAAAKPSQANEKLLATLAEFYKGSLPDGIYLNLPADRYHADPALGSSNIRDLLKGLNLYWFKSSLNPKKKKDKLTPAKIVGNATHSLLLDGRQAFEDIYVRGPYGEDDDHLKPAEKSALTKKAKEDLMEGQELLTQADYDFVVGCKAILDADPDLKGCLDNALTELSIFWTRPDGVRVKARHDAFKLRGIGDIKTIANERERDLEVACRLDITTYRYDIPAQHYMDGRRAMVPLFNAEKIWTMIDDEPKRNEATGSEEFLKKALANKDFGFQLVFIPKKGAPDAWSCVLSPGNDLLEEAATDIETAIGRFKQGMVDFGLKNLWTPRRSIGELYREDLPMSFGRSTRAPR